MCFCAENTACSQRTTTSSTGYLEISRSLLPPYLQTKPSDTIAHYLKSKANASSRISRTFIQSLIFYFFYSFCDKDVMITKFIQEVAVTAFFFPSPIMLLATQSVNNKCTLNLYL